MIKKQKKEAEFERSEVKSAFEAIGWQYITSTTDKKNATLEIDGIATYGRRLLVIECKGWKLRPFYEYPQSQAQLLRDIKGIVDGIKYTSLKPKKVTSLLTKLEFVKKNMSKWGLNLEDFDDIDGLIILRNYPPILDYKGIQIISIRDIPKLAAKVH